MCDEQDELAFEDWECRQQKSFSLSGSILVSIDLWNGKGTIDWNSQRNKGTTVETFCLRLDTSN
jgi:hypothetical protein